MVVNKCEVSVVGAYERHRRMIVVDRHTLDAQWFVAFWTGEEHGLFGRERPSPLGDTPCRF